MLALRWPHDSIHKDLRFGNGQSIFEALGQMMRECLSPDDWECDGKSDHPHVAFVDRGLYAVAGNRRLTVLMMYQALLSLWTVYVCNIGTLKKIENVALAAWASMLIFATA